MVSSPVPGPNKRVTAFLIDFLVISVLAGSLSWLFSINDFSGFLFALGMLLRDVVGGQGPGKRLVGIRVVASDGKPAKMLSVIFRNMFMVGGVFAIYLYSTLLSDLPEFEAALIFFTWLPLGVEYATMRKSVDGRRIGDINCRTRVIDLRPQVKDSFFLILTLVVMLAILGLAVLGWVNITTPRYTGRLVNRESPRQTRVSQDLDKLWDSGLRFAQQELSRHGEFYPFGESIETSGQRRMEAGYTANEHTQSKELIKLLIEGITQEVADGKIRAAAIFYEVRVVPPGKTEKVDAIVGHLESSSGEAVDVFLPYRKRLMGRISYGKDFALKSDSWIFHREKEKPKPQPQ